jgi:hypothetical protein
VSLEGAAAGATGDPSRRARPLSIEFIGPTGAGKTTLARRIVATGVGDRRTRYWTELVTDRPGLRWVRDRHAINLLADVAALPAWLPPTARDRELARFAFDRLRHHAPSTALGLNYLRNLIRKIGIHRLAERSDPSTAIVFDEGTILLAYQLFVYSRAPFTTAELERFAELVPLSDRIVHVRAPLDVLTRRATERPDRRRELARTDADATRRWIERAVDLFDALVELQPIRERTRTVELRDGSPDDATRTADEIVGWLGPEASPGTASETGPRTRRSPTGEPNRWRS